MTFEGRKCKKAAKANFVVSLIKTGKVFLTLSCNPFYLLSVHTSSDWTDIYEDIW